MLISLDYDHTYTADKLMWQRIIPVILMSGHTIKIVTMRHKELDWHQDFEDLMKQWKIETIFCDGQAKRKVMEDLGFPVDIWIDDWPEGISMGSQYTPVQLTEWREAQKA